jgi:NAD(P)-dependent dehydrogenase (short-subunit alcohol dehydrogenase family)
MFVENFLDFFKEAKKSTMTTLAHKTLIITGASGGIGKPLALGLARMGVNLILNARHSTPLAELASRCQSFGIRVRPIPGDVAKADVASKLVAAAVAMGHFYGFLHVAGVLDPGPFLWELPEEQFREVFDASVGAGFQLARFAVPELMKEGDGVMVFFGSGAAEKLLPGIAAYCGAKAAEEHLARLLAAECSELTTFVYRPGTVETRMQQQARGAKGGAANLLHQMFQGFKERGELLSPEESAEALINILTSSPRRFHGKTATWRDGISGV